MHKDLRGTIPSHIEGASFKFKMEYLWQAFLRRVELFFYGYSKRDVFDMDDAFLEWLADMLCEYKRQSKDIIDLSLTKVNYEGKQVDLDVMIDLLLTETKKDLNDIVGGSHKKVLELFSILLPYLWI